MDEVIYFGGLDLKKVRKAIIPAAGLGTRFLPVTKAMPKECYQLLINQQFNT